MSFDEPLRTLGSSRSRGYDEGYDEPSRNLGSSRSRGYDQGFDQGYDQGHDEGYGYRQQHNRKRKSKARGNFYEDQNNAEHQQEDKYHWPKRDRRGVSVFQRQLLTRKNFVEGYDAAKEQRRRDRVKIMRNYRKALKDLDREHKLIFGEKNNPFGHKRDFWREMGEETDKKMKEKKEMKEKEKQKERTEKWKEQEIEWAKQRKLQWEREKQERQRDRVYGPGGGNDGDDWDQEREWDPQNEDNGWDGWDEEQKNEGNEGDEEKHTAKGEAEEEEMKESNWSMIAEFDTHLQKTRANRKRPRYEDKLYIGNGVINAPKHVIKGRMRRQERKRRKKYQKKQKEEELILGDNNNGEEKETAKPLYSSGRRLESHYKAKMEAAKERREREKEQKEREERRKQIEEELEARNKRREQRHKIVTRKTARGQPHFAGQMQLLLKNIQTGKETRSRKKTNDDHDDENRYEMESAHDVMGQTAEYSSDSGIDDFLEDSE